MNYQLRKSDTQKDYYTLVSVDKDNNEKLLADGTLDDVRKHPKAADLKPVNEKEIRGSIESTPAKPAPPAKIK